MKAVILAAGCAKRMGGEPKPLIKLFGLPIIEHTIRKLKGYEIIVVYHKKEIADYIKEKFPDIKLVYNNQPDKENGWSLYLARDFINDDFILLMADHFYGEKFFNFVRKKETTVFVSKHCSDAVEATKVKVSGNKVVDIGKELKEYDYFDTGLFYCKREIFDFIEKLKEKKEGIKLAEVIKEMAKEGKVSYEVVDDYWIDIDTREELKKAEKLVEKSLIKKTDGIVSRNLNRKISTKITKFLLRYDSITPNLMTFISFLLGIFSSFLFLVKLFIPAGLMTQFCSIIDGCDGEIARIKNMKTRFGAVIDALLDRYADILIVFGMFYAYGIFSTIPLIAFSLALVGCVLPSYVHHMTNIRLSTFGRDVRLFIIMIGGILSYFNIDFLFYTLLFLGIMMNFGVIITTYMGAKVL